MVLVCQHFKVMLEFLHLMELLDQHLEDGLQEEAADQKMVMEDLVEEVMEHQSLPLLEAELQALPILVEEEEEQMLQTDQEELEDQVL